MKFTMVAATTAALVFTGLNTIQAAEPIKVFASKTKGDHPAVNTLDGDLTTRWNAKGEGEFIQYKFAEPTAIEALNIAFFKGDKRSVSFKIESTETPWSATPNWQTHLATVSDKTTDELQTYTLSEPVTATYFRIVGYGFEGNWGWSGDLFSINDVEFIDEDTGGDVIAETCSVSASIQHDTHVAERAIDESLITRWSGQGVGSTLTLTLCNEAEISGINAAWLKADEVTHDFSIEVSTDNETWTEALAQTTSGSDSLELQTFSFQESVTAKYIRYTGYGNSGGNTWNNVTEFSACQGDECTGPVVQPPCEETNTCPDDAPQLVERSFWFTQEPNDASLNNGVMLTSLSDANLTSSTVSDDGTLIYQMEWTGDDFDKDGFNDTLSFSLHAEAFSGSNFSYNTGASQSSVALGNTANASEIDGVWGVGDDNDLDDGESIRFTIKDMQVSVADWTVELDGFTSLTMMEHNGREHQFIIGEGNALDSYTFDTPSVTYSIPSTDNLTVTGAGSLYDHLQAAVSDIGFKIRVTTPAVEGVWNTTDYSQFVTGPRIGADYPAQEDFTNYPEFSWDTIPRWLIVRKSTAYTDAHINSIANNYDLVVWEKANSAGFNSNEEGILDTSSRIRNVNEKVKNIFYFNTQVHYGGYDANEEYDNNAYDWSVHNNDGSIYMFKDLYYWHNTSVPAMRDWWVDTLVDIASYDQIDGVFVDKVTENTSVTSAYDEDGNPRTDYLTMLDDLAKNLPKGKLYLGNSLRNERDAAGRQYMEMMDGSYLERWNMPHKSATPAQSDAEALAVSLQLMREALLKGKMILFKTESEGTTEELMTDSVTWPLALYLIIADEYGYFAFQGSVNANDTDHIWDASWMDVFNKPLGAPLAPPVKDGFIYTRSYEHVDVYVNLETQNATLTWK